MALDTQRREEDLESVPHPDSTEETSLITPDTKDPNASYKAIENDSTTTKNHDQDSEAQISNTSILATLSLLLIGVLISNADGTLLMATYTSITSDFLASSYSAWLTTSYTLATCSVQPLAGKLSDIYGRKAVLLISYFLFATGCVICGLAPSIQVVILGRVVSGLGAAGMTVLVSVLIADMVPLIEQARWRSYVNVFATLGRSVGGPLGGFLADSVGWRWAFAGQGPLMVVAMGLVGWRLRSDYAAKGKGKGEPSRLRRVDFVGAAALAGTIIALLWALDTAGQNVGEFQPLVVGLLFAFLALGTFFVIYENRWALEPVFPPKLLIQREVATAYAIMALQTAAQLGMMYSVPLYFLSTQAASTTEAGAHLFPAVLGNTAGALITGAVIHRTGRYKTLTILGSIFSSSSYLLLILRWHGHTNWLESLYIVPGGFGTGIAFSTTFVMLTSGVKKSEIAVGTGGLFLSSSMAMVIGIAASSAVQLGSLRTLLVRALGDSNPVVQKVIEDVSAIHGLEGGVRKIVVKCYIKSLEYCHINAQDRSGGTALHRASVSGHSDVVKLLLDQNADPNTRDIISGTALQRAAADGYDDLIRLLLDKARMQMLHDNLGGLHFNVQLLMDTKPSLGLSWKEEPTPMPPNNMAAPHCNELLVMGGTRFTGSTPLQWAAANEHEEVLRVLLDNGADPNIPHPAGRPALERALKIHNSNIVHMLLDKGAQTVDDDQRMRIAELPPPVITGLVNMPDTMEHHGKRPVINT